MLLLLFEFDGCNNGEANDPLALNGIDGCAGNGEPDDALVLFVVACVGVGVATSCESAPVIIGMGEDEPSEKEDRPDEVDCDWEANGGRVGEPVTGKGKGELT